MAAGKSTGDPATDFQNFLFGHVSDSSEWHPLPGVNIHLNDTFSVHVLMLVFGAGILLWTFLRLYRKQDVVPTGLTNFLEIFVLFIRDEICIPSIGKEDGRKLTPIFCSVFFFILILNIIGLIPLFTTATGNYNVTAGLALITFALMIGSSIWKNGPSGPLQAVVPHGIPWPVLFILVPIEIAGLFIKPFALAIRLFANLLAGHIVLFSMLGLIILFGSVAVVPSVLLGVAVYMLEVLVAFLQAYIFTYLSAMFVGMMVHPDH